MARPILLAVDDDISVLEAVVQDLRRHYGADYRVMRAASGNAALDTLTQLKVRQEPVALLLSDQRMPGMTGVEFLERARVPYPDARRVLLTAYADTEAAIQAINTARIHYYLTKPWDPPEEKLYPVLTDLLEDWKAGYQPAFEGLRVVGHRWSLQDHRIRSFLSRNHVPYRWLDIDAEGTLKLLEDRKLQPDQLPVVLFSDGTSIVDPEPEVLAARVGLRTRPRRSSTTWWSSARALPVSPRPSTAPAKGCHTLVIEPVAPGGQAGSTSMIENYLGFPAGITGADMGRRALIQATRFGAEFVTQRATGLRIDGQYRFVQLADGREVSSHVVMLAPGVQYRKLDIPGAERLTGRGIFYGAALVEAASCKDQGVYVVGGANSAGQAALYFAKFASSVTMLVRGKGVEATMSKYLIDEIARTSNIVLQPETQVLEAIGEEHLERLRLSGPAGESEVPAGSLVCIYWGGAAN